MPRLEFRRSLPSRLFDDLVSCALGPTSHPGAGEQRARFSPAQFPQWFDEQFPAKYEKQYREACDSRTLHFHNRQYLKSSVKLLSASIRVDWFSLPMEKFLDRMPLLRQGLVKASSPWAGNKSQSIQVSLCLPNQRDLDTWYEAVFALPLKA